MSAINDVTALLCMFETFSTIDMPKDSTFLPINRIACPRQDQCQHGHCDFLSHVAFLRGTPTSPDVLDSDTADNAGIDEVQNIRKRLTQPIDLWDKGKYYALVDDTKDELCVCTKDFISALLLRRAGSTPQHGSSMPRYFLVASARPYAVSRTATAGEFKTGRPALEVLRDKHPAMREPDLTSPCPFEPYESTPDTVPLNITVLPTQLP